MPMAVLESKGIELDLKLNVNQQSFKNGLLSINCNKLINALHGRLSNKIFGPVHEILVPTA